MVKKGSDPDILEDAAGGGTAVPRRRALLDADAFQNAILASAALSVMATDADGNIQMFNAGAERLLGYTAAEVIDRITAAHFHDPQELMVRARAVSLELSTTIAAGFEAMTCKALRGGEDRYEATLIRKNLERVPVAMAVTAQRDGRGCLIGYTVIATDRSDRKGRGFEAYQAPTPAQHTSVPRSDLLTHMSHEMRTPLSAILGFAQLMDCGNPSPTILQKRSIDRILEAGWHLEKLINGARDLALLESGTLSLSPQPVPLAAVMLDCRAMIESQAQRRGVRVAFPSFDTPWFVSADRIRLLEVLGSLLAAAISHCKADGAVAVECESRGSEWIRVGIGVGREGLSAGGLTRALDENAVNGTHLGLMVARRLVELMGGTIGAVSIDGDREIFSFDLKRMPAPVAAGHASIQSGVGDVAIPGGGRTHGNLNKTDIHAQPR